MAGAENLRLRVYREDAFPAEVWPHLLTRPLAPGLVQAVVRDFPDKLMPVNRIDLDGADENVVFGRAAALSLGEESYVQEQEAMALPMRVIGGTHRYVGSHLQVLRRYVDPATAPYGALIALPLPEYVFIHVISPETHVILAIDSLQSVSQEFFGGGDHPITPQVYWWRPGAYEALPEEQALVSGQVPDLQPVAVEIQRDPVTVNVLNEQTNDLIQRWLADNGA
ncbi:hypothetical protein [Kribbella sp. NPDC055071]